MSDIEIVHDVGATRFEIHAEGERAGLTQYRAAPRSLRAFLHTEISEARQGQGLGTRLIRSALDSTRDEGLGVLPYCPLVRGFIVKNPGYLDLVPGGRRSEFQLPEDEA